MFYSVRCEEELAAHVQFISTSTLIYLTAFLLMLSLIPVCVFACTCRYLEYVRIPHTEPIEHEFRWGQRADAEVSKAKILEFMGEVSSLSRARLHLQMKLWLLMMVCVSDLSSMNRTLRPGLSSTERPTPSPTPARPPPAVRDNHATASPAFFLFIVCEREAAAAAFCRLIVLQCESRLY